MYSTAFVKKSNLVQTFKQPVPSHLANSRFGSNQELTTHISTGIQALDDYLGNKGWRVGSLTECLYSNQQCTEALVLTPTLQALAQDQKEILFINAPSSIIDQFAQLGIPRQAMRVVGGIEPHDPIWALEMALLKPNFGALLIWTPIETRHKQLSKLRQAISHSQGLVFSFRTKQFFNVQSHVDLQLHLELRSPHTLEIKQTLGLKRTKSAIHLSLSHQPQTHTYSAPSGYAHLPIPARRWQASPWSPNSYA